MPCTPRLIGRAHTGELGVRAGLDVLLPARNAFLSVPLDRLSEPVTDELAAAVAQRLELTRYLVGLGTASLTA